MINEALYNKTVDILVQAYYNDTLKHGKCSACAVGNICHAVGWPKFIEGAGMKITDTNAGWKIIFRTNSDGKQYRREIIDEYAKDAIRIIKSTGYTVDQLSKVEYAFETAPKGNSDDEWMFNGLMAVIEVLDIIHKNTDTTVTTASKKKFVKQLSL